MSKFSFSVIFSVALTIGQFKFIHSARIDILAVRAHKWNYIKLVRKCGKAQETQMHVLTMCDLNLVYVRTRHDSIMPILKKYIKHHTDYTIYADEK